MPPLSPSVRQMSSGPSTPPTPSLPSFHMGMGPDDAESMLGASTGARLRRFAMQPKSIFTLLFIVMPFYGLLYVLPIGKHGLPGLSVSSRLMADSLVDLGRTAKRHASYHPGELGRRLALKHTGYTQSPIPLSELFSLSAGRDDSECVGWSPQAQAKRAEEELLIQTYDEVNIQEDQREGMGSSLGRGDGQDRRRNRFLKKAEAGGEWDDCWKAKMWNQIEAWEWTKPFSQLPEQLERNTQALDRLSRCLVSTEPLPEYPPTPETFYDTDFDASTQSSALPKRDFFDRSEPWISEVPCSQTSTKVVIGLWWYFALAFTAEPRATSGEAVWMRSQISALYAQGYTILAVNDYAAVTDIHRAMPDVISHIWAEERFVLTCQDDPRCIEFSTFETTEDKYDVDLTEQGEPTIWNQRVPLPQDRGKRKWLWTRPELDAIPDEERGTIPLHKLFTTTYWGARPYDNFWGTNEREFWWNPLGQEWTLSPFDYPDHTFIPFSIEKACLRAPFFAPEEREDQVFVLAKRTTYFQAWSSSIAESFWPTLESLTGLSALSVAVDDHKQAGEAPIDVPEGVNTIGKVTMDEFEQLVGKSRLMLGIGRPGISPSVYSALCQGTPVAIPYYKGVAIPSGWNLFDGSYTQHGPAAALGPPYVYSYDTSNETMLVDIIKEAANTPIDRFIPPEMSHRSQLKNMDDIMRFDWRRHADAVRSTGNVQGLVAEGEEITEDFELRRTVLSWCHETGRCQPVVWEI